MHGRKRNLTLRLAKCGKLSGYPVSGPQGPMTLSLIINVVFAALVILAIPGMLAWAIVTSRNDGPSPGRAVRRPMPRLHFPAPRLNFGQRRPPPPTPPPPPSPGRCRASISRPRGSTSVSAAPQPGKDRLEMLADLLL